MSKVKQLAQQAVIDGVVSDLITTFQCRPYTIVEVYSDVNGFRFRGVGEAKCGKNDIWNDMIGYEVAFGRAVKMIVKNSGILKAKLNNQ